MNTPCVEFLGWHAPAIELVAEKLLTALCDPQKAPLYRRATVVVPTAESGRRLREYLAQIAGKPLLIPRIILANQIIPTEGDGVASEAETMAAWLHVLGSNGADAVAQFAPLIPRRPEVNVERWAVGVAHKLVALRARLEQEEISYHAVTHLLEKRELLADEELRELAPEQKEEAATWLARKTVYANEQVRWRKLGELFSLVDACLSKMPISEMQEKWVSNPTWPKQSRLLIMACVPEFSPQIKTALRHLHGKDGGRVEIWVHAPETEAAHFDAYGLPLQQAWLEREVDIADSAIHLVNDAEDMAQKAVELTGGCCSQDLVLAVGDAAFSPALVNAYAETAPAWVLNLPEGRHPGSLDMGQLVAQLADACAERERLPLWQEARGGIQNNAVAGLEAFVALLHNTALQCALCASSENLSGLQEQVEKIRMLLLPGSEAVLVKQLEQLPSVDKGYKAIVQLQDKQNPAFYTYAERVSQLIDALRGPNLPAELQKLANLLESRIRDSVLAPIAGKIASEMRACAQMAESLPSPGYAIELLKRRVQDNIDGTAFAGQSAAVADILGWREMLYTRGGQVIVAAMHDGAIPEPVPADDFLPESLCDELGLRHEKFRMARDSYLLTSLLESRREKGRVSFLLARQKADGSVLAPSSLLLRCGEHLPQRAKLLFAESKSGKQLPLPAAFPLRRAEGGESLIEPGELESISQIADDIPNPYTVIRTDEDGVPYQRSFSPSSLSLFLQCPLSFWIKNLFKIDMGDTYKEGKGELESNEYGTVMHAVLDKLVKEFGSRESLLAACPAAASDTTIAAVFLLEKAKSLAAQEWQHVYNHLTSRQQQTLSMEVQLQAIERTLDTFVQQHVQDLQDGWYNVAREYTFESTMALDEVTTVSFSMNADRIDRHKDGRWRIIDYKTSTKEKTPHQVHFDKLEEGEDSVYCRFMNVQGYEFGTVKLGEKIYRWNDVQLPLYTYGLRHPSAKDREALHIADGEDMSAVMPDLVYYNLQSKTEELRCYYLVKNGEVQPMPSRSKDRAVPTAEELYESAMKTVQSAIRMIRDGKCLFSAESLEIKRPYSALTAGNFDSNAPRFGALSPENDPRCMFALPPLDK